MSYDLEWLDMEAHAGPSEFTTTHPVQWGPLKLFVRQIGNLAFHPWTKSLWKHIATLVMWWLSRRRPATNLVLRSATVGYRATETVPVRKNSDVPVFIYRYSMRSRGRLMWFPPGGLILELLHFLWVRFPSILQALFIVGCEFSYHSYSDAWSKGPRTNSPYLKR